MATVVEIDPREITITPVFKYVEVENIPKSETAGHAVLETKEMVEVRFAGSRNYSPMFLTDEFWKREGNRVITYAERWPDQYRAFKEGSPQEAQGTPLEMLRPHGVTPEQVSLCRALKIYSIEALHHLEGTPLRSLGMNANKLKDAARDYMAAQMNQTNAYAQIEELRAELAAMRAGIIPVVEAAPAEIEAALTAADASFADLSDEQIKSEITKLTGSRPKGNPSRITLEAALSELLAA